MPKCYEATYQQFTGDNDHDNCPELIRRSFSSEQLSRLLYDAIIG
jgi:hypothetical protein